MTFSDDRIDYDPKVVQPYFLCGWCHKTHNGDCEEDMQTCNDCNHAYTYHAPKSLGTARTEGDRCISWGCDCKGWDPKDVILDKPEDQSVWNT